MITSGAWRRLACLVTTVLVLAAFAASRNQARVLGNEGHQILLPVALKLAAPEQVTSLPPPEPTATARATETAGTPAPPAPPTFVSQEGGTTFALAVAGDLVYVATGSAITVYNVADPARPVAVGRSVSLDGLVSGLALHGPHLLAAVSAARAETLVGAGLVVLNLAEPARPQVLADLPLPGGANDVVADGDHAYVTSGTFGFAGDPGGALYVVDVRNGAAPRQIARLALDMAAGPVVAADGYVYIGYPVGRCCATVVDVTDPARPTVVAEATIAGEPMDFDDLALGEGFLVAVEHGRGSMVVFDIHQPRQPELRGLVEAADAGWPPWPALFGATIHAGRLLAVGNQRLASVAISDLRPDAWMAAAKLPMPGNGAAIVVSGSRAFVAANWNNPHSGGRMGFLGDWYLGGGLVVLGLDDPALPTPLGASPGPSADAVAVVALGDRLVIAEGGDRGLQGEPRIAVIDAVDPERPIPLAVMDLPSIPRGMAAAGDTVFVLTATALLAIDLSDSRAPRIIANTPLPQPVLSPTTVIYEAGRLYTLSHQRDGAECVGIVDVHDPARPLFLPGCDLRAWVVARAGDGLLVAADDRAVTTWRVDGLSRPTGLGQVLIDTAALGKPFGLTVDGTTALLTTDQDPGPAGGLVVVDVAGPTAPRLLGQLPGLANENDPWPYLPIALGRRAILVDREGYFRNVDLADPRAPVVSAGRRAPFVEAVSGADRPLGGYAMQAIAWHGLAVVVQDSGMTIARP